MGLRKSFRFSIFVIVQFMVIQFMLMAFRVFGVNATETAKSAGTTVCPKSGTTSGVDISDYQTNPQWPQMVQSGRRFVFIKASEGTNIKDRDFSTNWETSKSSGLVRGSYHFFIPSDDPVQQADHYLSVTGTLEPMDLPPMVDLEVTDRVVPEQIVERTRTFLDRVETSTGRVPIIYVSPDFWNGLGNPQGFDRYPLFVAHYGVPCPEVPLPWKNWSFWQRGISQIPGIKGSSDQDVFNGVVQKLEDFLALKVGVN